MSGSFLLGADSDQPIAVVNVGVLECCKEASATAGVYEDCFLSPSRRLGARLSKFSQKLL
jgi:hypothetical protein